ncbi:MAG: S1C family serine protease [Oscillospiraceae bacterium]
MKKRVIAVFLVVVLCLTLMPTAMAADTPDVVISSQSVMVDGQAQNFEAYNIDGNNYFKLRDIAYVLSGTDAQFALSYDSVHKLITVTTGQNYSPVGGEMKVGDDKSDTMTLSSQMIMIDGTVSKITAYNIGGNNFFQLRELADALAFTAGYDAETNTVVVDSTAASADQDTDTDTDTGDKAFLDAEDIYAKCSPAVFYIEVYNSSNVAVASGSGFFIDDKGTAVTNFHVIDECYSAKITTSDTGKTYDVVGIYDYSREDDWAVIKVDGSGFSYLTIGDEDTVIGGATIYAIGSPLGLQNSITQGLISNPARVEDGVTYIQISAAISSGSSGGALINKYGEAIGITSGSYVNGQNMNLALPISYIENASTKHCIALSETWLSDDPITYLKEYVVENGAEDEIYDEDTYGIVWPTDENYYSIYYSPESDSLFLEFIYYPSNDSTCFMIDLYITGDLTSAANSANHRYGYYFMYFDDDDSDDYLSTGSINAPNFTENSTIAFQDVHGDSYYTDTFENLGKYMFLDLIDATQYQLDYYGLPITIADLGFTAEYKDYIARG